MSWRLARLRLLACDLDGTLLDPAGAVPAAAGRSLAELHRRGVVVLPVTARMPRGLAAVAAAVPFAPAIVCANGAIEYDPGRRRATSCLAFSAAETGDLVGRIKAAAPGASIAIETARSHVRERAFARPTAVPGELLLDELSGRGLALPAVKISVQDPGTAVAELTATLAAALGDRCRVIGSGSPWVDVSHRLACKELAVARWASAYGVPRERVLAVGDSPNDLGMLRWAGLAAAVARGDEALLAAADVVLPGGHEGVVALLDEAVRLIETGASRRVPDLPLPPLEPPPDRSRSRSAGGSRRAPRPSGAFRPPGP